MGIADVNLKMSQLDRLQDVKDAAGQEVEREILRAIKSIRYGSVEIIVHDSKVVQIERKEKVRFDGSGLKSKG